MTIFLLFLGLAALVGGAELLVRGASRLAAAFGISPLVIGLTIVSFGTSSPELAVSIKGALTGHPDLVIGNCVGSTMFNVLLTLGLCALVAPLVVIQQLVWLDVPIMIGAHVLLLGIGADGLISRWDGLALLACLAVYILFSIKKSRKETAAVKEEYRTELFEVIPKLTLPTIGKELGFIAAGLVLCVLGAEWMMDSAVTLARVLGVSELVIGLTIMSASTSMPELATSLVATIRGHRDIAIGNIVGSNIFNILGIIGVAGLIAPNGIVVAPSVLQFDLPVAIATCVACLPIFFTDHTISRWEGALFLAYYAAYTAYLLLAAQQHEALPAFSMVMLWFVIPITVVTFLIILYRKSGNRPNTSLK